MSNGKSLVISKVKMFFILFPVADFLGKGSQRVRKEVYNSDQTLHK